MKRSMAAVKEWLLDAGSWVLTFLAALLGVAVATFAIDEGHTWTAGRLVAELAGSVVAAAGVVAHDQRRKSDRAGRRRNLGARLVKMFYAGAAARAVSSGIAKVGALLVVHMKAVGL